MSKLSYGAAARQLKSPNIKTRKRALRAIKQFKRAKKAKNA